MLKFHELPIRKRRIYATLTIFSVLPFLLFSMPKSVHVWQWNSHLISITTSDWTVLWIPSPNLALFPPNKLILSCKLHWSATRRKKQHHVRTGGVLQKSFPKNFTKFTEKYMCYNLFLILFKVFGSSGVQLYWRETP